MQQKRNITDDEIIKLYNKYKLLGKIAHELKLPHVTIHRRCARLGLTFKNGGQRKGKKTIRFTTEDILNGEHPQYPTMKVKKRILNENILEYKCDICKISSWNGKKIILQLDHINGIPSDHRLKNLRLLCPNCHSQTDTYCGKNHP